MIGDDVKRLLLILMLSGCACVQQVEKPNEGFGACPRHHWLGLSFVRVESVENQGFLVLRCPYTYCHDRDMHRGPCRTLEKRNHDYWVPVPGKRE